MDPEKARLALRERIKELNCLYGIARMAELFPDSLENLLRHLVEMIPLSWQYPEVACMRIVFKGRVFKSRNCKVAKWRRSSQIAINNESVGKITIFYLEERPPVDEGPFLKEERVLLDEVAKRISAIAIRIYEKQELRKTVKSLELERAALQEANVTLRYIQDYVEEARTRTCVGMQANVDKIIMPILRSMKRELPEAQRKYVEILKASLEEMTSPVINTVLRQYQSLTQTEAVICTLIRNGLRTKDIAESRAISTATVNRHREHIRRKLRIMNRGVNLQSYLSQCIPQDGPGCEPVWRTGCKSVDKGLSGVRNRSKGIRTIGQTVADEREGI